MIYGPLIGFILNVGNLDARIVPDTDIDLEKLQSGNLMTKRKNISLFLKVAMMKNIFGTSTIG